uniref:VIT domain-containing protein n=1 Tax=Labrus bergylta TaxID=56723 RepID=A0A3Q3L1N4_9LABR
MNLIFLYLSRIETLCVYSRSVLSSCVLLLQSVPAVVKGGFRPRRLEATPSDDWDIYSFHINSTVSSRYATTVITSRVANRMDESKEIEFQVRIPKNAFISKFRMFIDGQAYDGVVKSKEAAKQQYTDAVSQGQSAGIVSSVGRTLEEFKTSVNVAAHKKVTFELTYEELLKRKLGKYELQIHARPMQVSHLSTGRSGGQSPAPAVKFQSVLGQDT